MIQFTTPTGHPVLINPSFVERVRLADAEASTNARTSIDLQSGKSEHVLESFEHVARMLGAT